MRTSNPMFNNSVFDSNTVLTEQPMTISGTLNKLFLLSVIFSLGAGAIWYKFALGHFDLVSIAFVIALFATIILAFVIRFKPQSSPYTTPLYALGEGVLLATISCLFEAQYPGIVVSAVMITFITLFSMFFAYKTCLIQATETFKKVIILATSSIFIFYLISIIAMWLFKVNIPYFNNSADPLSIGINVIIAIIAALSLVLDFDFIEQGANRLLPKYFEWYGAFGLLVTIFWIYLEVLRLLARLSKNR